MRPYQLALIALAASTGSALAQSVPAIEAQATASSNAQGAQAAASMSSPGMASNPTLAPNSGTGAQKPPPGWPPAPQLLSPSAPLDHKEAAAVASATAWRNKADRPMRDPMGVLRWVYGASQARVVCAPLQICDIELGPDEVVNDIRLGDITFWNNPPPMLMRDLQGVAHSHVTVTPLDAGRSTSMIIYTDERIYTIKLVSTQHDYTPRTGFVYADRPKTGNAQDGWASYRAAVGGGQAAQSGGASLDPARIEMLKIEGDKPSWRPIAAYTDGKKTYVQFPSEMQFSDSPSLLGVNDDGGIFRDPSDKRVIYRVHGDRLVADTVMHKLKLVLGVGGQQQVVTLTRRGG